jgi:hypothetical protein
MFASLREREVFSRVALSSITGTVEWPNGADLAPEALHELPEERTQA